jgi:Ca2+-transporting ATPase
VKAWHCAGIVEVMEVLATGPAGLSAVEAARRLARYGRNELPEKRRKGPLAMLAGQFADFLILVLLAASIVAMFIGDMVDVLAILAIVILNAVIGFFQEYRAERAMAALRRMAGQSATVVRDGAPQAAGAAELVPGDLILLEAGNVVPADVRLVEVAGLQLDEAALTGESLPMAKVTVPLADPEAPLGDRCNLAYKGTIVCAGRGRGVVIATGLATELGKIAAMLQATGEPATPLQRRLSAFGQRLGLVILAICGVVFLFGYLRGEPLLLMLLTAISLAVAAIPEALPAVVTISLALGAAKMARHNALVRRLPAVETLGSVTYICTDKTGTLTENRMAVLEVFWQGRQYTAGQLPAAADGLLTAAALNSDALLAADGTGSGDPTELAFARFTRGHGYRREELELHHPRIGELPFDASRRCMTTIHQGDADLFSVTKGAVEVVLERSTLVAGTPQWRELLTAGEEMAGRGLRVLAVASRRWSVLPAEITPATVETGLTVLGLVAMQDPPRAEAREAVRLCRTAGIVPVMITGDHPVTASNIGQQLGLMDDGRAAVLTGQELSALSAHELARRVTEVRVYARVAPEQKLQIVTALQERGEFVAMTGDGVNDAPALQRADIGVAMGITGTDVAKESADLILLDDNFATIVQAVREGRRIYANILKFITYSITANCGTLVAVCCAPLLGMPLPLIPVQILWLNLLTDSLPGLALAMEPAEPGTMSHPPIRPEEGVFADGRGMYVAVGGVVIGAAVLGLEWYAIRHGMAWQTMLFTFLVMNRVAVAYSNRSFRLGLFRLGLLANRPLLAAIAIVVALQLAAVYLPALQMPFKTERLAGSELTMTLLCALAVAGVLEAGKLLKK